ncbi:choice-of-anchor J domain-containing protein [Bizionia sediminis]|uniref:Choice-of-anchor J domain-containing protein n=1 Tax=Bizionia sediminis TaxID=1737064 RepID=A0ABW5KSH9_9FLAO
MKKITLFFSVLLCYSMSAQTNLFQDDFESYTDFAINNVGSWTLIDVDGLPTYGFQGVEFADSGSAKSFQVFNSTATTPVLEASETSNWEGYNSTKGMVAFAAVPSNGVFNNDWLISPQITLAENSNTVSFWYKGCDAAYSSELFTVGISTTDTNPSSFTVISANPESVPANDITWRQLVIDIPDTYNSTPVYIAINCVSQDQFGFMIDDFSVDTALLSTDEYALNNIFIGCKDNVITISNMPGEANYSIVNMAGQEVLKGNTRLESQNIDASNLAAGIYIVEITDVNSNAQKRKKVVIE